ncbi:HAD domain-containing protein [Pseudoduganella sp. R-32]|uniref:HAD domain-containing protein n=1 Tax=unclassified Pseudoduganella TaxID=2637179 RepID=UPI003CF15D75
MILFLDFDGVLHPFPMRPTDKHFSQMSSLWKVLDNIPEISVVITSTWREQYPFTELIELLKAQGGDRFAARFVGVTPILEGTANYVPGIRQREVETWLAENKVEHEPYIILDDIEEYFNSTCKNLYLVDGVTGLTDDDVKAIALWLKPAA